MSDDHRDTISGMPLPHVYICATCKDTGWVEAPSHSVERSQFGVGPTATYVCRCRRVPSPTGSTGEP